VRLRRAVERMQTEAVRRQILDIAQRSDELAAIVENLPQPPRGLLQSN
jgi:hypothetical protein